MCDGETSASNKCAMAKYRLNNNKMAWHGKGGKTFNKPGLKAKQRGTQTKQDWFVSFNLKKGLSLLEMFL